MRPCNAYYGDPIRTTASRLRYLKVIFEYLSSDRNRARLGQKRPCHLSGSRSSVLLSRSLGTLLSRLTSGSVVFLAGAVNGDLDSNLTALNLLSVHLLHSLFLLLLRTEGDETEATALASLVAGLELLDHEAGDGAKSNLGGNGLVGGKDFLQLRGD